MVTRIVAVPSGGRLTAAVMLTVLLCVTAGVGLIASDHPSLMWGMLAVGLCVPLIALLVFSPTACTLTFVFILYTNAAGVAVNIHGLPMIVGQSFMLLLLPPLTYFWLVRRERIIIAPALPFVGLFILVQAVGTALSTNPKISLGVLLSSIAEGLVLFFLITNVVRTARDLRRVIWTLLAAGAFLGCLSLLQYGSSSYHTNMGGFMQNPGGVVERTGPNHLGRLGGPIDSANVYAQIMLMLVPLGMFRFLSERTTRPRILAAVATVLSGAACALCASRGAAVGFVLTMMVAAVMGYINLRHAAIVVALTAFALVLLPGYRQRILTIETAKHFVVENSDQKPDSSIRGRMTEMIAAVMMFCENPIIGVGPGMNKYYMAELSKKIGIRRLDKNRKSHSLYPDIAADYGILGLSCFLAILFLTLHNLARVRKRWLQHAPEMANMATGFFLAIVAYMSTGIFIHFSFVRFFWSMLAFANVACVLGNDRSRNGQPPFASR